MVIDHCESLVSGQGVAALQSDTQARRGGIADEETARCGKHLLRLHDLAKPDVFDAVDQGPVEKWRLYAY